MQEVKDQVFLEFTDMTLSWKSKGEQELWLHTLWVWGVPEGKWLGLGSAQVSCYPRGCGYTEKDTPQGKI